MECSDGGFNLSKMSSCLLSHRPMLLKIEEEEEYIWKQYDGSLHQILYKKQLYYGHRTQGKCHNMKLEAWVVGCTIGSRGEAPGERKPVIEGLWWW
jgi:hypothetical protein